MKRFPTLAAVLAIIILLTVVALATSYLKAVPSEELITITVKKPTVTHATSTTPAHPDGAAATWTYSEPIFIEKDVAISRIEVIMQDAPPETIHHLSVLVMGRADAVCGHGSHELADEIYTASRNNLDPLEFPEPYGVHLKKGDVVRVEFMEHTRHEPHGPGGTYHDHALTVQLHTTDLENRPVPLEFIRPRLDDSPCALPIAHQAFEVPPGDEPFVRKAGGLEDGRYIFVADGLILNRGANFWPDKGGQSLTVYLNDREVDHFVPTTLDKPWLYSIPNHVEPIPVTAGDVLTIDTVYQNPFQTPIKDAAGILGFYFAASSSSNQY